MTKRYLLAFFVFTNLRNVDCSIDLAVFGDNPYAILSVDQCQPTARLLDEYECDTLLREHGSNNAKNDHALSLLSIIARKYSPAQREHDMLQRVSIADHENCTSLVKECRLNIIITIDHYWKSGNQCSQDDCSHQIGSRSNVYCMIAHNTKPVQCSARDRANVTTIPPFSSARQAQTPYQQSTQPHTTVSPALVSVNEMINATTSNLFAATTRAVTEFYATFSNPATSTTGTPSRPSVPLFYATIKTQRPMKTTQSKLISHTPPTTFWQQYAYLLPDSWPPLLSTTPSELSSRKVLTTPTTSTTTATKNWKQGNRFVFRCGRARVPHRLKPKTQEGSIEAFPHSWPWQAALGVFGIWAGCGAAIVSEQVVLTAAHCLDKHAPNAPYCVFVGLHTIGHNRGQCHPVSKVEIHPKYNKQKIRNDLAILYLAKPLSFTDNVQPACLPSQTPKHGKKCYATGWGMLNNQVPNGLRQKELKIMSNFRCSMGYMYYDRRTQLCVKSTDYGDNAHAICQGDSGGPMMCQNKNGIWELHGISSFHVHKGVLNPATDAVTRIISYKRMIESAIRQTILH